MEHVISKTNTGRRFMKKFSVIICLVFLSLFLQTTNALAQEPTISYRSEIDRDKPIGILRVDNTTIKKVADIHPRFAVYLAGFRGEGRELSINSKVYMTPIKITAQDIDIWLKPAEESETLIKELVQKQWPSVKGRKPAIFITYTEISEDKKFAETRLTIAEHCVDDPLKIEFMKLKLARNSENGREFWKITECTIE